MIGNIFYWVFNMSISATVCAAAILIPRAFKRIPRRISVLLWWIPFLRMCIPFGIGGSVGLMPLISRLTKRPVAVYPSQHLPITSLNFAAVADSYDPITYKSELIEKIFLISGVIWLALTALLISLFILLYISTIRGISGARHLYGKVYVSDRVRVPAVYGIIGAKIVIPENTGKDRLEYIIRHEQAHIRRGDNILRIMALCAICVHWFNPFCLLFFKLYCTDTELACDESVLSKCNEKQKKEYAHMLIGEAEKLSPIAPAFSGTSIRTRIENIISFKRLSLIPAILSLGLIIAVFFVLLTIAK